MNGSCYNLMEREKVDSGAQFPLSGPPLLLPSPGTGEGHDQAELEAPWFPHSMLNQSHPCFWTLPS